MARNEIKWRHEPMYSHMRGRVRASCRGCGGQSPWFEEPLDVIAWWAIHTKLREKKEGSK